MNILKIIGAVCARTGLSVPAAVVGTQDDQLTQLLQLANEGLDDIANRNAFTRTTRECLHTTLAQIDQGDIETIADQGFQYIIENKLYNRSTMLNMQGPVSSDMWQQAQANASVGFPIWRIREGHLLIYPAPAAGQQLAFEYASSFFVQAATGTYGQYFTADTDTFVLPHNLMLLYLRWRWKAEKGLQYGEEYRLYETTITNFIARDTDAKPLDMGGAFSATIPGIFVSPGGKVL